MALNIIRKQLNSSMSPQAMRVFNRCAQRVINAIDEAAEEMADYPEAAYYAFLDELEGSIQATLDRLREGPLDSSRGVNSSRPSYQTDDDIVVYPNGQTVSDIDITRALDYMYGTNRNLDETYTSAEIQRAVDYWVKMTDGDSPY